MASIVTNAIKAAFEENNKKDLEERFLSPAETCKLFQPVISKMTLRKWTEDGRIEMNRIGGRVYYKYSEVLRAVTKIKRYKK